MGQMINFDPIGILSGQVIDSSIHAASRKEKGSLAGSVAEPKPWHEPKQKAASPEVEAFGAPNATASTESM